jgi:hypothetical protein
MKCLDIMAAERHVKRAANSNTQLSSKGREMKKVLLLGVALATMFAGQSQAANLVTFDGLSGGGGLVPDAYQGLHWTNLYFLNGTVQAHTGYQPAVVSPNNVAFNGFGSTAFMSDGLFMLESAYLTAVWRDGLQVEVIGSVGGTPVPGYDNTFTLSSTAPTFITFNYYNIDAVQFISFGGVKNPNYSGDGTQFAMDNVLIPEPTTTLLLLGLGAGTLWMLRKNRAA